MAWDEAAAVAHLRAADPVMAQLIDAVGEWSLEARLAATNQPTDPYGALVRSIIGQQVSTASARAIHGRLLDRFGGRTPTPAEVLADDPDELRTSAGLSRAKLLYLRSLAEHVVSGQLDFDRLETMSDDEVVAELTAIKGIGEWSAHVFLIMALARPDVLPVGDLGIRRAAMIAYGLDELPGRAELEAIGEPWRPYRTLASLYLWRSLAVTPI